MCRSAHKALWGLSVFFVILAVPAFGGAVITNGNGIYLGVNDYGHLGYTDGVTTTLNGSGGAVGVAAYADLSAYSGYSSGIYDSTTPGCICEGWGVAVNGATGGGANLSVDGGAFNLSLVSFTSTSSTATSVTTLDGTGLQITQEYSPSSSDALFVDHVTLTNTSDSTLTSVLYRRVMDWDVPPGEFSELVTIQGWGATALVQTSDNGFASANPLSAPGYQYAECYNGDCTRTGPADHGALFDFNFGTLTAGQSIDFYIYYGAATSQQLAMTALSTVGAEVYSFGQYGSSSTEGEPLTYVFGFKGVGGSPVSDVPEPATYAMLAGGLGLVALFRKVRA